MHISRTALLLSALLWSSALSAQDSSELPGEHRVDLRSFDFPTDANPTIVADVKVSIFFLSNEKLALFFELRDSSARPVSHRFKLLTFSVTGEMIAERVFRGDGKFFDVKGGPDEDILLRESEKLDFFDAKLRLVKTHQLPLRTVGIAFDRALNQLVVITTDSGNQTARFLDPATFDELTAVLYPQRSIVIFGRKQLGYTLPGSCQGALHLAPDEVGWRSLDSLQACDALAFVGDEALAYASTQDLYVVHKSGKQLFHDHIPAPDSFHLPNFVGLSDDHSRLAVMALMKRGMFITRHGTWPYYNEVYVYDLDAKKLIFKHELVGGYAAALSSDGHKLATIESGNLKINSIR